MFWGFNFEHNLRYPKITRDIMVYTGFRDAWRDIPDPPQAQLALTSTMKKTCLWQRLWRLVFSQHWTKIRPICYPVWIVSVLTRSGPQFTDQKYPGLSQFIWWYPWPVNPTILVLLLLENSSIWQYEHYFFGVCWRCSESNLYSSS